ncbi:hypothetical protein [Parapedobacter pyrenivorans]
MEQQLTIPLLKWMHAGGYMACLSRQCAGSDERRVRTPQFPQRK